MVAGLGQTQPGLDVLAGGATCVAGRQQVQIERATLAGGTTAGEGWNFAANGGLTIGDGTGTVFKTNGTNSVLCMVTSAAAQLSGSMTVVAAP